MARLEGASAVAFERLAAELARHGAPPSLVVRAQRAIEEERRHEELVLALAREHGERGVRYAQAPGRLRSLLAMAIENAREGVVSESFGALLNVVQARDAPHARMRALFESLAEDEVEHAALSLEIHAWACAKLDARSRGRVKAEVRSARARAAARCGPDREHGELLGHPPRVTQLELLAKLDEEVLRWCA
jgi:hypothetical protein